jgi:hypothetical protein
MSHSASHLWSKCNSNSRCCCGVVVATIAVKSPATKAVMQHPDADDETPRCPRCRHHSDQKAQQPMQQCNTQTRRSHHRDQPKSPVRDSDQKAATLRCHTQQPMHHKPEGEGQCSDPKCPATNTQMQHPGAHTTVTKKPSEGRGTQMPDTADTLVTKKPQHPDATHQHRCNTSQKGRDTTANKMPANITQMQHPNAHTTTKNPVTIHQMPTPQLTQQHPDHNQEPSDNTPRC